MADRAANFNGALGCGFNLSFLVVRAVRGCFSHAQCQQGRFNRGSHALEYTTSP